DCRGFWLWLPPARRRPQEVVRAQGIGRWRSRSNGQGVHRNSNSRAVQAEDRPRCVVLAGAGQRPLCAAPTSRRKKKRFRAHFFFLNSFIFFSPPPFSRLNL